MHFVKNENWYGWNDGNHEYVDPVDGQTYQMYQTTNGLIVYGDIASLNVFSADGKKVAGSTDSQFVNTSALVKGMYIVLIKGKDGSTVAQKFLRR